MSSEKLVFDPSETTISETRRVSCNGGGGALGHPLVYMEMGSDDYVVCKYCDRKFVLKGGSADPSAS